MRIPLYQKTVLFLMVLLTACDNRPNQPPDGSVVNVVTSPDGFARAFVVIPKMSGGLGATLSQPYQVWMESLKIGTDKQLIVSADKTDGFHLSWTDKGQLEVCYGHAQIFEFRNTMVMITEESQSMHVVEIVLKRADKLTSCQ